MFLKIVCTDTVLIKKGGGTRPNETLATNYKFVISDWKTGAKSYQSYVVLKR
jgi:hypothetical protein